MLTSIPLAERARLLRFHGTLDKQIHTEGGYNSRPNVFRAAVLGVLLPELDGWYRRRRSYLVPGSDPDGLVSAPAAAGVQARCYYCTPVHRQPAMTTYADGELLCTDETARSMLALPMGPELRAEQVEGVMAACTAAAPARVL
jgi:UDP-N-acetyl-3-dehydro-alpha-D-glucosamine 3-aminotranferase